MRVIRYAHSVKFCEISRYDFEPLETSADIAEVSDDFSDDCSGENVNVEGHVATDCRGRKDNLFTPPPLPHILSYSILNCSVDLLQTTFSGSAFQGMTTRCEKKFLRGSHLDLSLYIFKLCPLRRVSPLVKKVSSRILQAMPPS